MFPRKPVGLEPTRGSRVDKRCARAIFQAKSRRAVLKGFKNSGFVSSAPQTHWFCGFYVFRLKKGLKVER